ncbi:MAG: DUF4234 domain-containing protein, partial [Clostridia bacterium]|nr:DUF4234 domain-containing protein [Clostridia bacterium]
MSIITLGLYDFYWAYLQIKNVRALKEDKSSCIGETLCFLLVPFYSFYWFYTRGQYLYSKFTNENRPVSSSGIAFLLLDIFGLRIIALSIMQSDFNRLPYGGDNGNPDTLFIILMLAYPVLQFAVFFIYVNLNTVKMSFEYLNYNTGKVEINGYYYRMFFYELVNMDQMKIGLKNSLLAMLNNIFVMMPLGVICGYFFYKKVPCSAVFKVIFFIPNIISIVVLSMVYKYMFDPTLGPIAEIMRNFGWEVIPDFFNDPKYAFPLILLYCNWAGVGYNTLVL